MKPITMAAAAAFFAVAAKADDTINNVVPTDFDQLVSGSIETCAFGPAVTNVKAGAFAECRALQAFHGDYAQSVGAGAFRGCVSLEAVSLGVLTNLTGWSSMFAGCPKLLNVWLPKVGIEQARAAGLPFGTPANAVVFHLADGEYDRNGRKID
ncbi:MAG: hypothetical protein IJG84_21300 [Kiritimatiellae bacterium]|nr:hypothetical protein [Kiritimatiellia bacterium]